VGPPQGIFPPVFNPPDLRVLELANAKMREALCGVKRIVMVVEAGMRSTETRVDGGYSTIFEN
jgi:hypothetical protein